MKGIVVTDGNIKSVIGRLEKFFNHKNFIRWHRFDGGMSKRISSEFNSTIVRGKRIDSKAKVYDVFTETVQVDGKPVFCIHDSEYSDYVVQKGVVIWFLGSRIIIKEAYDYIPDMHYLYTCYQINDTCNIRRCLKGI